MLWSARCGCCRPVAVPSPAPAPSAAARAHRCLTRRAGAAHARAHAAEAAHSPPAAQLADGGRFQRR
eukprot:362057-Chlamydomonas_euryale.AAC.10